MHSPGILHRSNCVHSAPIAGSLAIFGVLLSAIAGCQSKNQFVAPPPPQVTVAQPLKKPVVETIDFIGSTRSVEKVDLRSRVNGYLEGVLFVDGAEVVKDQPLFQIEREPYQIAVEAAEAELARTIAIRRLAEIEYQRSLELLERKAITDAERDSRKAEFDTASANVKAAEAAVKQAQLNLSYTTVKSPITGKIGRRMVDVGNLVQAEQTLLATVESLDPIYVYFTLSERDLLRFMRLIRENKLPNPDKNPPDLHLGLSDEADFPHPGKLDFRDVGVDPLTGTTLRRGTFPNPDHQLVPGLFARIRANVGVPVPHLLVEERAVSSDQRGDFLLVVNDKKVVEYRPVTLGPSQDGMVVVERGLSDDDWVVINGLQRARPGIPVNPEQAVMTPESAKEAAVAEKSPAAVAPAASAGAAAHGAEDAKSSDSADATPVTTTAK